MGNQTLQDTEKKIKEVLADCGEVQFSIHNKYQYGIKSDELEIRVKSKVTLNVCPNYCDSRNDCEGCELGNGWHLVEGKCSPKGKENIGFDYDK